MADACQFGTGLVHSTRVVSACLETRNTFWSDQRKLSTFVFCLTVRAVMVSLLLDEPTNHLDMEAVIWLEQYLAKWNRILLLVSHSQDFLNNVCSHMIHFTNRRKLVYYDGNYDQFVKTKTEKEENQWKQYRWEQEQIKSMKEYIARFGHGTAKNAKQAQSKEKVLQKMIRAGLTEKPEEEKPLNFKFNDPGHLPPPVLAFHDVSFGYPGCDPLYTNVNFGVDLDSRVALVGPNGAGELHDREM
jgi:ATP-binding cassette subfamily F protein 2